FGADAFFLAQPFFESGGEGGGVVIDEADEAVDLPVAFFLFHRDGDGLAVAGAAFDFGDGGGSFAFDFDFGNGHRFSLVFAIFHFFFTGFQRRCAGFAGFRFVEEFGLDFGALRRVAARRGVFDRFFDHAFFTATGRAGATAARRQGEG